MKAKFISSDDELGLGIAFDPENTDEQLLLTIFTRRTLGGFRFDFHSFEMNNTGRQPGTGEGITQARGSLRKFTNESESRLRAFLAQLISEIEDGNGNTFSNCRIPNGARAEIDQLAHRIRVILDRSP